AMRAVVDNPGLAAMAGARPNRIAQFSWALGAALAALGGVLLAPLQGALNIDLLTLTVILAIVPAVIGRLRSLPLTVAGGLVIGLAVTYAVGYLPPDSFVAKAQTAIPMVILFVALVLLRQERLRSGRVTGMTIARAPSLSRSLVAAGVFIVVAVVVSELVSGVNLGTATRGVVLGIAFLSLVLLTGYAGQVSLGQMTFVGTGAYAMAHLGHHGSLVGVLAAVAVSGGLGALVAIFAVRLRGLYLALSTLAFAYAMDYIFFDQHFGPYGSGLSVDRLHVPGLDTTSDKGFFILGAVIFALAGVGLLALRRGRYGRRLAALNDSPQACATLGVNIAYTKLAVFSASAALAGLAGALYGGQQHLVTSADFQTFNSLVLLLLVLLGGKSLVSGALATAVLYALFPVLQQHVPSLSNIQYVLVGLGALTLGRNPEGLGGQITRLRDLLVDRSGRAESGPAWTVEGERLVGADG
ncbi:MAG TPA: ABC transporter permease, partial [Acidimicrobiales bacterium]|nr:ABC transporter permease [Acidimicrobiales bacterium]